MEVSGGGSVLKCQLVLQLNVSAGLCNEVSVGATLGNVNYFRKCYQL